MNKFISSKKILPSCYQYQMKRCNLQKDCDNHVLCSDKLCCWFNALVCMERTGINTTYDDKHKNRKLPCLRCSWRKIAKNEIISNLMKPFRWMAHNLESINVKVQIKWVFLKWWFTHLSVVFIYLFHAAS